MKLLSKWWSIDWKFKNRDNILHIDETNVILRNQENSLIHTLYDEDKGILFTKGIDGSYYWDPSIYEILECKPRTEDTSYNILKDVMKTWWFWKIKKTGRIWEWFRSG